jgi:HD-GYP domain-containing protein (c-di-GMP phosphodiesterase class II)
MFQLKEAIHCRAQLVQEIGSQLAALDSLRLPDGSMRRIRLIHLRRLARQIETALPEHSGHGERTAHYALLIGRAIGMVEDLVIDLQYAAFLHDIGLLTLPPGLLDKPAPLTLDEYVVIQSHPREGAAMLNSYRFLFESARLIAHHHERWDGAGYPFGLRGTYIPLSARILAIADAFDTLTSRSGSFDNARRTLRASSGTQFDPTLLETFYALLDGEMDSRNTIRPRDPVSAISAGMTAASYNGTSQPIL